MDLGISVVIPVFSRQVSAVRAIRSVVAQSGRWLELIVVDDASPVPFVLPPDLAEDSRIRILRLSSNSGASAARNAGVAAAVGDWIAFLDSDDIWLEGKLEKQSRFISADQEKRPDPLVLYCTGFRHCRSGAQAIDRLPVSVSNPMDFASGCWFAPGSTSIVSRAAFQIVGCFDTQLRRLEDLDWALRLGLAGGRLAVLPFIGSQVDVGSRPRFALMDAAASQIEAKWAASHELQSRSDILKRLRAYLNVEKAASCFYVRDYVGVSKYFMLSLFLVPRIHIHLRQWWHHQRKIGA